MNGLYKQIKNNHKYDIYCIKNVLVV